MAWPRFSSRHGRAAEAGGRRKKELISAAAVFGLMSRCLSALLGATLFVLIAMAPAAAQQGDLNAILKQFSELYAAGNYPAALVEAQKLEARVKARFGVNHGNYGIALNNLAAVYGAQGKYADAEGLFGRALAIREKALGASHPDVAGTLIGLAMMYKEQGKYAERRGTLEARAGDPREGARRRPPRCG